MAETGELQAAFIKNYSSLIVGLWTSEAETAKLAENPTAYAREKGLPVAPGAVVQVDSTPHDGLLRAEEVIRDWLATPGTHVLHAPATPLVDLDELADADLEAVAAGDNNVNACVLPD